MDQIMFDIGDTADIKVGDQVELIGPHLPLKEWAKLLNTISYELVTSLNLRLPKVYTRDL
jgi:alanine racemase